MDEAVAAITRGVCRGLLQERAGSGRVQNTAELSYHRHPQKGSHLSLDVLWWQVKLPPKVLAEHVVDLSQGERPTCTYSKLSTHLRHT